MKELTQDPEKRKAIKRKIKKDARKKNLANEKPKMGNPAVVETMKMQERMHD